MGMLDGKVAIVTGAGRGLGRAMALALADAGADIVATARTEAQVEETADLVKARGRAMQLAVPAGQGAMAAVLSLDAAQVAEACAEAAAETGTVRPFAGETRLFILPGYRFKAVDLLLTNFHLPRSTLFMLVAAFSGLAGLSRLSGSRRPWPGWPLRLRPRSS